MSAKHIIHTQNGSFGFDNIDGNGLSVFDMFWSLAHQCRYIGHINRDFYSVAEHSVIVSKMVPPEHALEGLIHDCHEAFVTDIPSPLKSLLPDYQAMERKVEGHVRRHFGFGGSTMHPEVNLIDKAICGPEMKHLNLRGNFSLELEEQFLEEVEWLMPVDAYVKILNRYHELTHQHEGI